MLTVALLDPTDAAALRDVAEVFDEYRQHYGEPSARGQTGDWLKDQIDHQRLEVFMARLDSALVGVATTVATPASLRLTHYWQIRDLYVVSDARRRGVARALLDSVQAAAVAAKASRVSIQTETHNAAALRLYQASGFTVVEGLETLMLPLHQNGG